MKIPVWYCPHNGRCCDRAYCRQHVGLETLTLTMTLECDQSLLFSSPLFSSPPFCSVAGEFFPEAAQLAYKMWEISAMTRITVHLHKIVTCILLYLHTDLYCKLMFNIDIFRLPCLGDLTKIPPDLFTRI